MNSFKQYLTEGKKLTGFRHAVWKAWKEDAFMPAEESHWTKMDHRDQRDFHSQVSDVMKHAAEHKIKDPHKAVEHHAEHIASRQEKHYGVDREAVRDKIVKKIKSGSGIKQDIAGKPYFPTRKLHH